MLLHNRHSYFSDDGKIVTPKHVEIYKYTKNKLCTNFVLFKRFAEIWVTYGKIRQERCVRYLQNRENLLISWSCLFLRPHETASFPLHGFS